MLAKIFFCVICLEAFTRHKLGVSEHVIQTYSVVLSLRALFPTTTHSTVSPLDSLFLEMLYSMETLQ